MNTIQQAKSTAASLRALFETKGVTLTQSEALEFVAKAEGCKDWNVLSAKLSDAKVTAAHAQLPGFCTKCGAHGTLEKVETVNVQQGAYDGEYYEYEGESTHYRCSACGGQFVDWNIDLTEWSIRQREHVLIAVSHTGGWTCRAFAVRYPILVCGYERTEDLLEWLDEGEQQHRATIVSLISKGLIDKAEFRVPATSFEEALRLGAAEARARGLKLAGAIGEPTLATNPKYEVLSNIGYEVKKDQGLWVWTAPTDACEASFATDIEALEAAWFDAVEQAQAILKMSEGEWAALGFTAQTQLLVKALTE